MPKATDKVVEVEPPGEPPAEVALVAEVKPLEQPPPPAALMRPPMVMFRVGGQDDDPDLRPAVVTRWWSEDTCNLQVFLDGRNDRVYDQLPHEVTRGGGTAWCTSVARGDGVGQWRAWGGA